MPSASAGVVVQALNAAGEGRRPMRRLRARPRSSRLRGASAEPARHDRGDRPHPSRSGGRASHPPHRAGRGRRRVARRSTPARRRPGARARCLRPPRPLGPAGARADDRRHPRGSRPGRTGSLRRAARPGGRRGLADGDPAGEPARGSACPRWRCIVNNNRRTPTVLVVEDDRVIAGSIGAHLRHAGMAVECVEDGDRALRKARFERPDVVVLDLMLPVSTAGRCSASSAPAARVPGHRRERPGVRAGQGAGAEDGRRRLRRQAVRHERAGRARRGGAPPEPGHPPGRPAREALDAGPRDRPRSPPRARGRHGRRAHAARVQAAPGADAQSRSRLRRDQLRQRVWGVPQRKRDRSVDVCVRKLRSKIDLRHARTSTSTRTRASATASTRSRAEPPGDGEDGF